VIEVDQVVGSNVALARDKTGRGLEALRFGRAVAPDERQAFEPAELLAEVAGKFSANIERAVLEQCVRDLDRHPRLEHWDRLLAVGGLAAAVLDLFSDPRAAIVLSRLGKITGLPPTCCTLATERMGENSTRLRSSSRRKVSGTKFQPPVPGLVVIVDSVFFSRSLRASTPPRNQLANALVSSAALSSFVSTLADGRASRVSMRSRRAATSSRADASAALVSTVWIRSSSD
jgi:hypothetical protein